MKRILLLLAALCALQAAASEPLPLPQTTDRNRSDRRSEFMSYTIRATAAAGDRETDWNYLPVEQIDDAPGISGIML